MRATADAGQSDVVHKRREGRPAAPTCDHASHRGVARVKVRHMSPGRDQGPRRRYTALGHTGHGRGQCVLRRAGLRATRPFFVPSQFLAETQWSCTDLRV